jgi:hypothetical protein
LLTNHNNSVIWIHQQHHSGTAEGMQVHNGPETFPYLCHDLCGIMDYG